jgi:oxaloacetate decarboxylase alpha subunit
MDFFDSLIKNFTDTCNGFHSSEFPHDAAICWKEDEYSKVILQRESACELDGTGFNMITGEDVEDGVVLIGADLNKLSKAAEHFRGIAEKMKADGILDPKVLNVDPNALLYQVPGGMLSNLISQLKQQNAEDKYYEVLAEVPRVREDFGYPPLVTPTSQIVGSQAVLNVLAGERYKMVTKESKAVLRGEYGRLPAPVNEEVRKKAIGDDEVITCRPADLLEPEFEKYKEETKDFAKSEEDVLSYALFPQVAKKFFDIRDGKVEVPKAETPKQENKVIELYVEDLT